jgi:hypothetical protein
MLLLFKFTKSVKLTATAVLTLSEDVLVFYSNNFVACSYVNKFLYAMITLYPHFWIISNQFRFLFDVQPTRI